MTDARLVETNAVVLTTGAPQARLSEIVVHVLTPLFAPSAASEYILSGSTWTPIVRKTVVGSVWVETPLTLL